MTVVRAPRFDRTFLPGIARNIAGCALRQMQHYGTDVRIIRIAVACYLLGSGDVVPPGDRFELERLVAVELGKATK